MGGWKGEEMMERKKKVLDEFGKHLGLRALAGKLVHGKHPRSTMLPP